MARLGYEGRRVGYVYALIDPRTCQIRYVGKTVSTPEKRLLAHIAETKKRKTGHKRNWIVGVLKGGDVPLVRVLESGHWTYEELNEREVFHIKNLRLLGEDLTNETSGGDGGYNDGLHRYNTRDWTEQERLLHSERMKEWHQELIAGGRNCLGTEDSQVRRLEKWSTWFNNGGKELIAQKTREAWQDPEKRERMLQILQSEERRARISTSTRRRYENPEERRRTGEAVSKGMTTDGKKRIGDATRLRHGYSTPIEDVPCAQCGNMFLPNRRGRQTCSEVCRRLLSAERRTVTMRKNREGTNNG